VEVDQLIARTSGTIRRLPIPVIAAIEGPCFGAAVELALACDVRVVGEGVRVGVPAVKLGILYRPDAIAEMLASVGRQTVARLLLLGERLDAEQALAAGFAARVVPAGHALDEALTLAEGAVGVSPEALAATKGVIAEIVSQHPDLRVWEERRLALLGSDVRHDSLDAARATLGTVAAGDQGV
jgi:enoyl-CoA hydratase/carnithine racemase